MRYIFNNVCTRLGQRLKPETRREGHAAPCGGGHPNPGLADPQEKTSVHCCGGVERRQVAAGTPSDRNWDRNIISAQDESRTASRSSRRHPFVGLCVTTPVEHG